MIAGAVLLAGAAMVAGVAALTVRDEQVAETLDLLQWTAASAAAVLLALARGNLVGAERHRRANRCFIAAAVAMLLGQLVWDLQALAGWELFPSPADSIYLLTGPCLLAGLLVLGGAGLVGTVRRTVLLDTGALAAGKFTACLALVLAGPNAHSTLQVLTMAGYSLAFIAPASLGAVLLLTSRAKPSAGSLLLPVASLTLAGCWAIWNQQFLQGAVENGGLLSLGFTAGIVGMGAGIFLYRLDPSPGRRWDRACEAMLRLLPLMMVITASAGIIAVHLAHVSALGREVAVAGGVVVMTLAMIRQSFLLGEHDRLVEAERQLKEREVELEQRVQGRTAQLAKATEEAQAASRAKGEFLANMSHEIRTPLNSVLGLSYLALQEADLQPEVRNYLQRIRLSGAHLLRLVDDILQMARIEAGKVQLELLPLQLADVLASVHNEVDLAVAQKGLKIEWTILDDAEGRFLGDAFRLKQILLNLVSNAIKFTEHGEIRVRASVSAEESGQAVIRFDVEDTGIGIDSRAVERIFEPFHQADNSTTRRFGGTGLGLAITRHLLDAMGGDIHVESRPRQGSRFWFTVRLERCEAGSAQPVAINPSLAPAHRRQRILIAEDDETNRLVATAMLQGLNTHVTIARDGHEAVRALTESSFDIVFMDVHMPGLDGLEVTRWARSQPRLAHTPIVAMTADVLEDDRRACYEAGMNDFIPKPIDPKTLAGLLAKWAPKRDGSNQ